MRKKYLKKVLSIGIVMTLIFNIVGCGADKQNQTIISDEDVAQVSATQSEANVNTVAGKEQITIRVADMSAWNNAYFEYGNEKGVLDEFFENDKYDITFEITSFANGPAEIEAFAAGELDFASMGSMPATTGASSDYGFKIVAATDKTEHIGSFVALADSGITSIADLKGKKVGTVFGGTLHYYTGRFLETAGLTYDDVEFINSGNETPSSLRAGELDAGAIGNNVAVELANEGTATLLADTIEGVIGFSEVCISDEIIENHDGLAAILLKGYDRLYQYIDENKEDYLAYLGGLTGVETDSILETWDLAEHKVYSLEDKELLTNAEELLTWMQSQDMVANTDVTLDDIIDFSVAKEAGY